MPRALIATLLLSVAVAAMAQQAEIRYDSDYAPHPHHRYPPRHYRKYVCVCVCGKAQTVELMASWTASWFGHNPGLPWW